VTSSARLFDLLEETGRHGGVAAELLPWLQQAFSFVPATTFIRFADFASTRRQSAARSAPFLRRRRIRGATRQGASFGEAMEELWKSFLASSRPLPGVAGRRGDGLTPTGAGFRMTDTGRRLLGIRGCAAPAEAPGPPSADAPAEVSRGSAELRDRVPFSRAAWSGAGRFCDRVGRSRVLFRISGSRCRRRARGHRCRAGHRPSSKPLTKPLPQMSCTRYGMDDLGGTARGAVDSPVCGSDWLHA